MDSTVQCFPKRICGLTGEPKKHKVRVQATSEMAIVDPLEFWGGICGQIDIWRPPPCCDLKAFEMKKH